MANHRVVVVGASAGGLEALLQLFGGIPGDFPAPILIVFHVAPGAPSIVPAILGRTALVPVEHGRDGEPARPGHVYVAPPDRHMLLLDDGRLRLSRGPRENHHRPAADPLFRSAARVYGPASVGLVLSGNLDDGAAGLLAIRRAGGVAVVQSPKDALYPGMPCAAIEMLAPEGPDHVAPSAELGSLLDRLVRAAAREAGKGRVSTVPNEDKIAAFDVEATHATGMNAPASDFICPDCGGTLYELREGKIERYRCRVGHAYSLESLSAVKAEHLEEVLWSALRVMEEHAGLARRSAARARDNSLGAVAERFEKRAMDDEQHAGTIRAILSGSTPPKP